MNQQDARTNGDRLRARNDYLAVLRQQESNLKKTANAMAVMAQTGQPPIPPTDTRSISEKLVDVERLKPMFRKQLMSLMDGREVERVMGELDNEEIQSAILIFGDIYNELKGKYPLGVPAPIFVEFLRRFLRDYNKSVGFLPKSKDERDALNPSNALAGTRQYVEDTQAQMEAEMANTALAREIENQRVFESQLEMTRQNTRRGIALKSSFNPDVLQDIATSRGKTIGRAEVESVMEGMLGQVEDLNPTAFEISEAMKTLGENPTAEQITEAVRTRRGPGRPSLGLTPEQKKARKAAQNRSYAEAKKRLSEIPAYSGAAEFQGLEAVTAEKPEPSKPAPIAVPDYMTMSYNDFNMLDDDRKVDLMGRFTSTNLFETLDESNKKSIYNAIKYYDNPTDVMGRDEAIELIEDVFRAIRQTDIRNIIGNGLVSNVKSAATGAAKHTKKLIVGRGLPEALTKKGKKDFSEKIDKTVSSLPETKSYVPFGKYVLNHRRLNDNKLMVRTIKGGAVTGIPTLAISPVLGGIIKKMVGGALPSYNEMSKLSEEEQNTLYKIFKISEVDNVDMLPAPNKTKEEEEFNRFQILKGQISAGNDNKELIKEFKIMLLKFIHSGKVPRGQGMEIVCDLMAMGH